jgi:hypothetical protein
MSGHIFKNFGYVPFSNIRIAEYFEKFLFLKLIHTDVSTLFRKFKAFITSNDPYHLFQILQCNNPNDKNALKISSCLYRAAVHGMCCHV